jgi:hypothetical protein
MGEVRRGDAVSLANAEDILLHLTASRRNKREYDV